MPAGKVIGLDKATAKIRAIGTVLQRPMKQLLAQEARLVAISFAKSTQPYGTGAAALKGGRNAVERDINRVYLAPRKAYQDLLGYSDKAGRSLAKSFWKALKEGDIAGAEKILREHGRTLRNVKISAFDGGAAHQAARDPRTGRVRSRANAGRIVLTDARGLEQYIKGRQDNVGTGKGGWADVARVIGGIRGLKASGDIGASWITHQAAGKGKVVWSDPDGLSPIITITSTVSYADRILDPTARSAAINAAHGRLLKSLQIAVKAEMKKLPVAA